MKFRKFESIENTYNKSNVSKIVFNNLNVGEWIVTEKLHGANFSIYIEKGVVIGFGSRNQFVDGSFYDSADLQKELKEGIEDGIFLAAENTKVNAKLFLDKDFILKRDDQIVIYGELVGSRVQKEVYYCDDIMFYMFDIVQNGKVLDKDVARMFYSNIYQYAVCAPAIHSGRFEDCITISNTFNSCVSKKGNNEAEGIIIEPVTPMFYENGKRILLKNKTRQFSEKNDGIVNIKLKELTEKDNAIFNKLMEYLNTNRLNAVRSKGHPERAVPYMLVKDIIEDYRKDHESDDLRKDCDNFKLVTSQLQLKVNKFIVFGDV